MNEATRLAIRSIDRSFYDRYAGDFAATRTQPWPGWKRVVDALTSRSPDDRADLRILDLGCGHGRFAGYLRSELKREYRYLGIDSSTALVGTGRARFDDAERDGGRRETLACGDVLEPGTWSLLTGAFDLIVLFGLLHHVPGFAIRRALLGECARRLAPGGLLALSFWQFGDEPRYQRKLVPWSDHNRERRPPIDLTELEAGDHLMRWGADAAAEPTPVPVPLRYCHHATPAEADRLADATGLDQLDRYRSDGRSGGENLYILLERGATHRRAG